MKPNNFEKPNFSFGGIYRGLVEDNNDPEDIGRLKVRIYGIHNIDGKETPIEELPWAYPALGLGWSGGYNVKNKDHQGETGDVPGERYDPGENSQVAGTKVTAKQFSKPSKEFVEEVEDPYGNACGTGGDFVVPKRGNWVFVFFDGGYHMSPIYFAMAPMGRDWLTQKASRNQEIKEKIQQIQEFREEFSPRKVAIPTDSDTWAPAAVVNSVVGKPKLEIPAIEHDANSNRDISCTTSAQGTTIIVDNRFKRERIYVIHKNFIDHTDEKGNKKLYIGKSRNKVNPNSLDPNEPTNYEIGVEGNHELHIVGDYDVYAKGNIFIQCDSNVQIDAKKNVGIVSREGDVDIVVERGNINADIKGNCDINVQKNANIKVNNDANVLVKGNFKATVEGTSDLLLKGDVKIETSANLQATVAGQAKITASSSVDITTPEVKISGNVQIGGEIKVAGNASVGGSAKIQQVCYVLQGIDCGGYIRNKGLADLGAPLIAHQLIVTGGSGTGTGRTAGSVSQPDVPDRPQEATRLAGVEIKKEDLKSAKTTDEE